MALIRPRLPNDIPIIHKDSLKITQPWDKWFRTILEQIPAPGASTVSSTSPLLIDTPASTLTFNADGTTYRDGNLHFPSLNGDVTNSGLNVSLVNVNTPIANSFVKITADAKGRITSSSAVSTTDLTPLLDSTYVNVSGDIMTGNLTLPNLNVTNDITNVENIQFEIIPSVKSTNPGSLSWNDTDGCLDIILKGGNVSLQVGQEQVQRMVNKSGVNVVDGQAVYVSGAQGNRVAFKLANANSEATSKATLGIVTEAISNNGEGFVTTEGLVRGLNTSAWAEGDLLYLDSVDGGLTNVVQTYPNHNVTMGYVVRSHAVVGSIYVKVNNGYELDELHNVLFTGLAANDLLKYDGAKWVNTASAAKADQLTTSRNITLSGDVTGTTSFNGTADATITSTLANSGVTAGTYKSVTVNAKGLVTGGTNPTTLSGFGIIDAVPLAGGVTIASGITITGQTTLNSSIGGSLQATGRSSSYGSTNGISTGAVNVVMGTSVNATWGISWTSGGVFRCGIQGLDAGGVMRFYVGTNGIDMNAGNWQPIANNTGNLGTSSFYWSGGYITNSFTVNNYVSTAQNLNTNAQLQLTDAAGANAAIGWRDLTAEVTVRATGANSPTFASYRNGIYFYSFSATVMNEFFVNFHIDHDYAPGTVIYPHIHWTPNTTSTGTVRWGIEYTVAKGHQQQAFPATTTVYVEQTIAANSQYTHFVAEVSLANAIPATNLEPDSIVSCRFFRDAAHANDTFPDPVFVITADVHYNSSKFATRNKAPNFYT